MTEFAQDIGGLKARMEDHDRRFDRLEGMVSTGFRETKEAIEELRGHEDRRKGALAILKILVGAGGLAGLWELARGLWQR